MIASAPQDRNVTLTPNATVLTIAGSDPSGGAGLQADLKSFQQLGCYGMSAVTLLTVQNTQGVERVELMPADLVKSQVTAATNDIMPRVIKTGALGSADIIEIVAEQLSELNLPLVVDPVLISKHGHRLADDDCLTAYIEQLFPLTTVLTPNRYETQQIVGRELNSLQDYADASAEIQNLGPTFVLVKAGKVDEQQHHLVASPAGVTGIMVPTLRTENTHGAGCVLSASIAAHLALTLQEEVEVEIVNEAIRRAINAVHHAIEFNPELGQGTGPVETRVIHLG